MDCCGTKTARLTFAGIGVYRAALLTGQNAGRFGLTPLLRGDENGKNCGTHYRGRWADIGIPGRLDELEAWICLP